MCGWVGVSVWEGMGGPEDPGARRISMAKARAEGPVRGYSLTDCRLPGGGAREHLTTHNEWL